MEAKEAIGELQSELDRAKENGQEVVRIDALEEYLKLLAMDASESIENKKLEYQGSLAYYEAQTQHSIAMFESVLEAGREALKAILIINGGAVIALLGFMGAILAKGNFPELGINLANSLIMFGGGVLLSALGYGMRYFSQEFYSHDKDNMASVFKVSAVLSALAAYAAFGFGIWGAYKALLCAFSP